MAQLRTVAGQSAPFAPSLLSSLIRATEINGAHKVRAPGFLRHADLVIEPEVAQFHPLNFDVYQAIVDAGYEAGREGIASWLKTQAART